MILPIFFLTTFSWQITHPTDIPMEKFISEDTKFTCQQVHHLEGKLQLLALTRIDTSLNVDGIVESAFRRLKEKFHFYAFPRHNNSQLWDIWDCFNWFGPLQSFPSHQSNLTRKLGNWCDWHNVELQMTNLNTWFLKIWSLRNKDSTWLLMARFLYCICQNSSVGSRSLLDSQVDPCLEAKR